MSLSKIVSKASVIILLFFLIYSCKKKDELIYGTVTDIDGNVYKTIVIGTQTWMAENLKVTNYNDSNSIPLVMDNSEWVALRKDAFCWYNNSEDTYKKVYGALYNAYTVSEGKLCPAGWHVPSVTEWETLCTYLGGDTVAGGKLKSTIVWNSPNTGADNSSGFTALPGGYVILHNSSNKSAIFLSLSKGVMYFNAECLL